jgi:hypothetical protein
VNRDVHGGHATGGSVSGASRFLIGLVTCFATPQQRDRALDPPRHQVAVRRLAEAPRRPAAARTHGRSRRGPGAAARGRAGASPRRVCWSPARSCHVAPEVPASVPCARRRRPPLATVCPLDREARERAGESSLEADEGGLGALLRLPATKQRLRQGRMMLVSALARRGERRMANKDVSLRLLGGAPRGVGLSRRRARQ